MHHGSRCVLVLVLVVTGSTVRPTPNEAQAIILKTLNIKPYNPKPLNPKPSQLHVKAAMPSVIKTLPPWLNQEVPPGMVVASLIWVQGFRGLA